MLTQIKKVGLANGVKSSGKSYTLSEMIQESYRVSYKAKELGDKVLINLTESHLMSVKKDPTNARLSEDLEVLQKLASSGKKVKSARVSESAKAKKSPEVSWSSSKDSLNEGLENFRKSARTKVFYKELEKFSRAVTSGKPITMNEAVSLYKASNSCLTHLTVELEKQPSFINTYSTCTKLLSRDNGKLLEAIQSKKVPDRSLLESYLAFTSILLECDAPEKPVVDEESYTESVNLPEVEDEDVINEEVSGVTEEDNRDVINEDDDISELDDKDVLNEGDEEDCEGPECEDEESLHEDAGSEDVPVDLTVEEIRVLKSILSKIASMDETEDPVDGEVPDEGDLLPPDDLDDEEIHEDEDTPVDEDIPLDDEGVEDDEISFVDDEEDELEEDEVLPEKDPVDDDVPYEDEEIPDEDEYVEEEESLDDEPSTEEDLRDRLVKVKGDIDEMLDNLPEKPEDDEDIDVSINEAIKNRIKKCF